MICMIVLEHVLKAYIVSVVVASIFLFENIICSKCKVEFIKHAARIDTSFALTCAGESPKDV